MPSLLHAIECECCVRRTGFVVFTKVLIINNSKVVITGSELIQTSSELVLTISELKIRSLELRKITRFQRFFFFLFVGKCQIKGRKWYFINVNEK